MNAPSAAPADATNPPKIQFDLLMQPGVLRTLRAISANSFDVLGRHLMSEAKIEAENQQNIDRPHIRLLAQMVRECDFNPGHMKIDPKKIDQRLDTYDKNRLANEATAWNDLKKILQAKVMGAVDRSDWMVFFKVLAVSIEGKERELGMDLVECALENPICCGDAIRQFPKVFKSARGKDSEQTALMKLTESGKARRFTDLDHHFEEPQAGFHALVDVVLDLQSLGLKTNGDLLRKAALASELVTRAFCRVYGTITVVDSRDSLNKAPCHHAAQDYNNANKTQRLIDLGADLFAKDGNNRTPLEVAVLGNTHNASLKNESSVAALLKAKAYEPETLDQLIDTIRKDKASHPRSGTDDILALLSSEKAQLSIDAVMDLAHVQGLRQP